MGSERSHEHLVEKPAGTQPAAAFSARRAAVDRSTSGRVVQTKLTVGPAGDRYEREADRIAQAVTARLRRWPSEPASDLDQLAAESDPPRSAQRIRRIQRSGASTAGASVGLAGGALDDETDSRIRRALGVGRPLDDDIRRSMETGFGADFSSVRVHDDAEAHDISRSIRARAFTTGNDIFFQQGTYSPSSADGQRLLAHELTHVVQQSGVIGRMVQRDVDGALGTWKTETYATVTDGVEMQMAFTPKSPVVAKKIGLVQRSKKVERGKNYDVGARADYEKVIDPTVPNDEKPFMMDAQKRKAQRSDGESHIDRDVRMNNPVYGAPDVPQGKTIADTPNAKLDMSAKAQKAGTAHNYQLGYRFPKFLRGIQQKDAKLYDKPNLPGAEAAAANKSDGSADSEMVFETTALVLKGKDAGTYLGSVEWGFKIDPDGVRKLPFRKLTDGAPTPTMIEVMKNWNAGEFDAGQANPQLPIPTDDEDDDL